MERRQLAVCIQAMSYQYDVKKSRDTVGYLVLSMHRKYKYATDYWRKSDGGLPVEGSWNLIVSSVSYSDESNNPYIS